MIYLNKKQLYGKTVTFLVLLQLSLCSFANELLNAGISDVFEVEEKHWQITLKNNGFSYDTSNQMMSMKGLAKKGLISVAKRGDYLLQNFWQEGAYRSTMMFGQQLIVDGYDIDDVSRISSFRFNRNGDYVFIHTTKGPSSKVNLISNNSAIYSWPRLTNVKIISFNNNVLILSVYEEKKLTTHFLRYELSDKVASAEDFVALGHIDGCAVLSSKLLKNGLLLQTYCQMEYGSDVLFLDFKSQQLQTIAIGTDDEFFGYSLLSKKQKREHKKQSASFPILTVSGSTSARQLYHAISGSILKLLGEPMSLSSDEAGKQSWSQSYRTLTLAELYQKTKHPFFAKLASQAMSATLRQKNINLGILQRHNPQCGWASRIYSQDRKTPLSFLINQGMIANSLIASCEKIGKYCSTTLNEQIDTNAQCLVSSYEYLFDHQQGLYRIPYASNFRYDGIFSPWNWHLVWAGVLQHVAETTNDKNLNKRVVAIIEQFIATWDFTIEDNSRVLWRYWTPHFYQGWKAEDNISKHRPKQREINLSNYRYEDLNHAGISLLGLLFSHYRLDKEHQMALTNTLSDLLNLGSILPRDMDGNGPYNPRWSLGAGWHAFATPTLNQLYSHKLPGSASSSKHLAYALLSNNEKPFHLQLSLSLCTPVAQEGDSNCKKIKDWSWSNVTEFLANNPLFSISQHERAMFFTVNKSFK